MAAGGRRSGVRSVVAGRSDVPAGIPGAADAAAGHVGLANGGGADNRPSGPATEMAP